MLPSNNALASRIGLVDDKLALATALVGVALRTLNDQTLVDGNTTDLVFDAQDYAFPGMHTIGPNGHRVEILETGLYAVSGSVSITNNATGYRQLTFLKNGATFQAINTNPTTGVATRLVTTTVMYLTKGDYLELGVFQDSGSNLNGFGGARFTVAKIKP